MISPQQATGLQGIIKSIPYIQKSNMGTRDGASLGLALAGRLALEERSCIVVVADIYRGFIR